MTRSTTCIAVVALALAAFTARAQVVGWRANPTGAYPQADAPHDWTDSSNVLWSVPMSAFTNSCPVVFGDVVFTMVETDTLMCLDADTGSVLWERSSTQQDALGVPNFTDGQLADFRASQEERDRLLNEARSLRRDAKRDPEVKARMDEMNAKVEQMNRDLAIIDKFSPPNTHDDNGYTSPTPVTNGEAVFVQLGTGVVAAYDMSGERLWVKYIQPPGNFWGQGASPALVDDTLVVSYKDLVGLDTSTGEEKWRIENHGSYGSPIAAEVGDKTIIITPLSTFVDPVDGRILGRAEEAKKVVLDYNTPMYADGVAYFIYHAAIALKLDRQADGSITATRVWEQQLSQTRYYATPLLHEGLIFAPAQTQELTILNADDGAILFQGEMPIGDEGEKRSTLYSSPLLAGDRVYLAVESGKVCSYKADASGELMELMQMPPFRTTPVIDGDRIYLRTHGELVCLSKPEPATAMLP